ncbi:MAG: UDP-N-acetylmuramoyl-tripeptide--D-alanyl-D-alanine ligase [bacterium]|nr:UDP-N-acetylmuramoyl-tripeptide--D-alanyl-D-alanine ligase [bacterium]
MLRRFFKKSIVAILTLEARLVLRAYQPRIVAITGSVGKTSTKDAVYAVLAGQYHVRRSEKSFNSEVGLPLTILGCPNAWNNPFRWLQNIFDGLLLLVLPGRYPQWLVLEVGADRPHDIRSIAQWLPVDIAVITRLPEVPVHVEFFDSPQQLVEEKAALIDALKPGGTLVLFADDERTHLLRARAQARQIKVVTFGLTAAADVRGMDFVPLYEEGMQKWPIGMSARIEINGASAPISIIGIIGEHMLLPAVAAAAVGGVLGKDLATIVDALRHYDPPSGRMRLLAGVKETLLIDDTYNSSPAAVVAALDALAGVQGDALKSSGVKASPLGRKIAILGDMLELGRHSVEEHRKIGAYLANKVDILVTVGFRARDIAQGALDNGLPDSAILQYEDAHKAGDELEAMLSAGDCVLVKGSQSMRMERVVEELMNEPERAAELLVRQDVEWKRR